jgi:hypothetical protein
MQRRQISSPWLLSVAADSFINIISLASFAIASSITTSAMVASTLAGIGRIGMPYVIAMAIVFMNFWWA